MRCARTGCTPKGSLERKHCVIVILTVRGIGDRRTEISECAEAFPPFVFEFPNPEMAIPFTVTPATSIVRPLEATPAGLGLKVKLADGTRYTSGYGIDATLILSTPTNCVAVLPVLVFVCVLPSIKRAPVITGSAVLTSITA